MPGLAGPEAFLEEMGDVEAYGMVDRSGARSSAARRKADASPPAPQTKVAHLEAIRVESAGID